MGVARCLFFLLEAVVHFLLGRVKLRLGGRLFSGVAGLNRGARLLRFLLDGGLFGLKPRLRFLTRRLGRGFGLSLGVRRSLSEKFFVAGASGGPLDQVAQKRPFAGNQQRLIHKWISIGLIGPIGPIGLMKPLTEERKIKYIRGAPAPTPRPSGRWRQRRRRLAFARVSRNAVQNPRRLRRSIPPAPRPRRRRASSSRQSIRWTRCSNSWLFSRGIRRSGRGRRRR